MKTLVVVGHPDVANSSTQGFFKHAAKEEPQVTWHVLRAPFDPLKEHQLLWEADRIVLEFPLYWYSVPAVMKDWIDQIFDEELLGESGQRLAGKEFGVVVTTGRALKEFAPGQSQGFTLAELLRPLQALANETKMTYLTPLTIGQFTRLGKKERLELAVSYRQYLTAEKPGHLATSVAWLVERLNKLAKEHEDQAPGYLGLAAVLLDNQEQLADLGANLILLGEDD